MARMLLGVTGGIAAYKALELTRLATKAGHAVRVIQTEASTRFVGTASFAAITGAPVLVTEWEPDPLRGAFPGDPAPEHAPLSHLALVERADLFVIAPASANTIAKLAARPRRQPADRRRARVPAAADRRSGHERRDVRASGDAREPRDAARPRRRGARARHRRARLAGGVGRRPPARAGRAAGRGRGAPRRAGGQPDHGDRNRTRALERRSQWSGARPRHRRRHARADRRRALRRQPLAPGRWAGRSPRRPRAAARRSPSSRPTWRCRARPASSTSTSPPPPSSPPPAASASRAADVLLMAAAVADYRPADARARQDQEGRGGGDARTRARAAPRTCSPRSPPAPPRPAAGRLRRRARRRRGRARARASSSASASTPSSSTTSPRPGIAFDAPDNEVTIVTAEGEHARPAGRPRRRSRREFLTPC